MCSIGCCHPVHTVIQTLMKATSLLFLMRRMCGSTASETSIYFGCQGIWFLFDYAAAVQAVSSCCQVLFTFYSCQTPPKGDVLDVPVCFGYNWELKMVIILEGVLNTDRALVLLEEYCKKLRKPEEQQLKKAIRKVMGIFKSSLFQALLAKETQKSIKKNAQGHSETLAECSNPCINTLSVTQSILDSLEGPHFTL
ncbi:hypothetical protein Q9966_013908 [Columba livia]|nr:hypothetical protein Q9966_013908 [Columba livia]